MSDADRARALNQRGNELKRNGDFEAALRCHEQAVEAEPSSSLIWHDLAATYYAWQRYEAAEAGFARALQLAPGEAQLHYSLSTALLQLKRPSEALGHLKQAVQLQPDYCDAWINLGKTLKDLGYLEDAEYALVKTLDLEPSNWEARWNLAHTVLLTGRFEAGWEHYEARRLNPKFSAPAGAPWNGDTQPDARLLLRFEQGLGDTLQFMRFVALARERVGQVVLQVNSVLVPLLQGFDGADEVISIADPDPACDLAAPLMSLPYLLGLGDAVAPPRGPYLSADPDLVQGWRTKLADDSRFRVGLVWQGNPSFAADHLRSIPLGAYEPVLRTPGARFMSLQKHHGLEQLADLPGDLSLEDLSATLDEETGPFCDTAALMMSLDLVITSDTSVAHLAGALGVPAWVGLPVIPDWRWELSGEQSRWYPSLRLFRQQQAGDWDSVMTRIAFELQKKVAVHDAG